MMHCKMQFITFLQYKILPKSEYPQNKTKSTTHDMHRKT